MSKIIRLPVDLANQIAAGEVVERPASVVKELVENALDAGARRVAIAVEIGGKRLIRVEDDGEGMSPEDARLALERHATSKIRCSDDLAAISTLGFRGEALPSIASVSRLTLRTKTPGTASGVEIRVEGGICGAAAEAGLPDGTVVEVADLFYNVPARRKFLKSDAAEAAQISRIVTQLSLAYPEAGFTLTSGGRTLQQCPPTRGLAERFFQVHGERPDLVQVCRETADVRLRGYVAALVEQGPARGPQNVFVNRRIVRDRTIAHAIAQAYSGATLKDRSPEVHLFIELPPDRVDVNVHPTKAEVRFLDQSFIHESVRRAVSDALGAGPAPALHLRPGPPPAPPAAAPQVIPGMFDRASWSPRSGAAPSLPPDTGLGGWTTGGGAQAVSVAELVQGPAPAGSSIDISPMVPLGQFRNTFIIAVDPDGVAIVDQHVAHERVLFEQMMERLTRGRLESQRLLEPRLVELSPAQHDALALHATTLDRFGLEVESFGGAHVRITAVPMLLPGEECTAAIRALAEDLDGLSRAVRIEEALRRIAATMACHAAVKANDALTLDKMHHILKELRRTAHSSVCPHGRPVVLRLTRREIERNFLRI
jgi:DNA mismatch repair protein MutL